MIADGAPRFDPVVLSTLNGLSASSRYRSLAAIYDPTNRGHPITPTWLSYGHGRLWIGVNRLWFAHLYELLAQLPHTLRSVSPFLAVYFHGPIAAIEVFGRPRRRPQRHTPIVLASCQFFLARTGAEKQKGARKNEPLFATFPSHDDLAFLTASTRPGAGWLAARKRDRHALRISQESGYYIQQATRPSGRPRFRRSLTHSNLTTLYLPVHIFGVSG